MSDGIHISKRMTAMDILKILLDHVHSESKLYPLLASHVTVTKAAGVWAAFPTPTQIVPADTILSDFDLHWVSASFISANGTYNGQLYKGAALAEVLVATFDFTRTAVQSSEGSIPIMTGMIPPNTRISAAISSSNNAQDTAAIGVRYHTY